MTTLRSVYSRALQHYLNQGLTKNHAHDEALRAIAELGQITTNMPEMVRQFHAAMDQPIAQRFSEERGYRRLQLVKEEAVEFGDALFKLEQARVALATGSGDRLTYRTAEANAIKEACDLLYVTIGAAVEFGWPIIEAFRRVHDSNMTKLGPDGKPVVNEDGKVTKGPNYRPPVMIDLVP